MNAARPPPASRHAGRSAGRPIVGRDVPASCSGSPRSAWTGSPCSWRTGSRATCGCSPRCWASSGIPWPPSLPRSRSGARPADAGQALTDRISRLTSWPKMAVSGRTRARRAVTSALLRAITAVTRYINGFVLQEQTRRLEHNQASAEQSAALAGPPGAGPPATLLLAIREGGSPLSEQAFEHGLQVLMDGTATALALKNSGDSLALVPGQRHRARRRLDLHATRERDQAIAAGMGKVLREARKKRNAASTSGTQRARGREPAEIALAMVIRTPDSAARPAPGGDRRPTAAGRAC